ncbi:MAG: ATP-grasp domain-containing protein [Candidatus Bathyarchaeota archaeon]|nr:ATP-grasp domain-containing protein [Candidatus Bathyarchaeota archaeon]
MKLADVENVLVLGIDVAALCTSARRAGYEIFAVDYYGDQDLKRTCRKNLSILTQEAGRSCGWLHNSFKPAKLLQLAKKLCSIYKIDCVVLGSGLDDSPSIVRELNSVAPIIGNSPRTIEKIRDKQQFFRELNNLGIPHPKTTLVENFDDAEKAGKDIGYPVVVKPLVSFGGGGIRKVWNRDELSKILRKTLSSSKSDGEQMLVQELISGFDGSVTFLSSIKETQVLTINEQLLGVEELGQTESFGYCGNVVPASFSNWRMRKLAKACEEYAQKIGSSFGLMGSNGIDVVISNDCIPYVVEVNPRFQGTLECVERVIGIDLMVAHMRACIEKSLFSPQLRAQYSCARIILYAKHRSIIPNLSNFEGVRDIPFPQVIIEEGEPVCSIVSEGKTGRLALKEARIRARHIYQELKPAPQ